MIKKQDDIIYIRKRKVKHWIIVLIFLVLVLAAVKTEIRTVNVIGNDRYTAEQAESMVFNGRWDRNTLLCLVNNIRNKKKSLPFVADYRIRLKSPVSCDLIIYEKDPVGCIKYMSSYMYFDGDGIVVESSQERLAGVPVIEGVEYGHIVLGEKLPVNNSLIFSDILNVTQQMELYEIGCDSISFDELMNITVRLTEPAITVEFGTNEDISAKISVLRDMLPGITERGLKGTLDLKNYKDGQSGSSSSFKLEEDMNIE